MQATGCIGADSYKKYARKKGYKHVEVWNWSSSAGDWQFPVSKDGNEWHMLVQENNYPRAAGFSHSIVSDTIPFPLFGTKDEVMQQLKEYEGATP